MRIAILGEDPLQSGFVRDALEAGGHTCHEFPKPDEFLLECEDSDFDLFVLEQVADFTVPEIMRALRLKIETSAPVIFTTTHGEEPDAVSILTAGADNYIVKPVSAGLLLARVNALLRRAYGANRAGNKKVFGKFEFELSPKQVRVNGALVPLTQKEFDLALLLFQNLNQPLSRMHIQSLIWRQTEEVFSRTIDTHLSLLRKKLGLRPENGYLLTPIHKYGYRLELIDFERWKGSGSDVLSLR
ncbi:response regulator transcription factor [Trinickia sp. YCB016]